MKYFQEITNWGDAKVHNHIYYLNDDRSFMVGYIQAGSKSLFKFKRPIKFDGRGRKFELLKMKGEPDSVYFERKEELAPVKNSITVKGSNGKEYFITKVGNKYSCTCPGYAFRHKCKHVEELNA